MIKRTAIRRKSKKKAKDDFKYMKLKALYFKTHPTCEACQCHEAQDIHHKKGQGINRCKVEFFMSVCRICHAKIESFRTWAYQQGYLLDRLGHE